MKKEFLKNNKALSQVVTVVLILVLVVVMAGIIWGIVSNLTEERLSRSKACYDIFEKIKLNDDYTCYYPETQQVMFSIDRTDFELDGLLVAISSESDSATFTLTEYDLPSGELTTYPILGGYVVLPGNESGKTYVFYWDTEDYSGTPQSIEIAPIRGEYLCSISDKINVLATCAGEITYH